MTTNLFPLPYCQGRAEARGAEASRTFRPGRKGDADGIEEEREGDQMSEEEWRPISGYDAYEVSDLGRVRSLDRIDACGHKRKVPTPRGGRWDHSSVGNVLQRLAA
jgi:hypothetical protein